MSGERFRCLKLQPISGTMPPDKMEESIREKFDPFDQFIIHFVNKTNIGHAAYLNFKYMDDAEAAFENIKTVELFGVEAKVMPIHQKASTKRQNASSERGRQQGERSATEASGECNKDKFHDDDLDDDDEASMQYKSWSSPFKLVGHSEGFKNRFKIDRRPGHQVYAQDEDVRASTSRAVAETNDGSSKPPNRCLYLGNLDIDVTEGDLIGIFSKYGIVQNVEIKKRFPKQFAFITYFNMDMAVHAKHMMTGQQVGRSVPRIGYGNFSETKCLWVGGIGPWTSVKVLHSLFSRFGDIEQIVWPDDRDYAYVKFTTVEDGMEAISVMNGTLLDEQKLRLDMVDVGLMESNLNKDSRTRSKDEIFLNYQAKSKHFARQRTSFSPKRHRLSPARCRLSPKHRISEKTSRERAPVFLNLREKDRMSRNRRSYIEEERNFRHRSPERREKPSSHMRSKSPYGHKMYSGCSSPISDSSAHELSESRRERSRSTHHTSLSPDRNPKKLKYSPSPFNRESHDYPETKIQITQDRDERTVVLKKSAIEKSSDNFPKFVSEPFLPPNTGSFIPMPQYPPPGMDQMTLYPPLIQNPIFPPLQSASFPIYTAPPPVSISVAPPCVRPSFYHPDTSSVIPLYNPVPPPVTTIPPPPVVSQQSQSGCTIKFPKVWSGALVLKNGAFVVNLHLVSGSVVLINTLLGSSNPGTGGDCPVLKIAQRLRLDQPEKLDELDRRLKQAGRGACSVLLATPAFAEVDDASNVIQQRPLQSLVTYLCQKEVAAVVPLPPGFTANTEITGMLHAFPPCQFARNFLQREAPGVDANWPADDQLLVIVCESNMDHN